MKQQKTILIVDDDDSWRDFHREILEEEGYRTEAAASRQEAYQKLDSRQYDIAIIDLRLDERDPKNTEGVEVVQRTRESSPSTFIIVKSAFLTEEIKLRLDALGVIGIIEKDGQSEHLLKLLNGLS